MPECLMFSQIRVDILAPVRSFCSKALMFWREKQEGLTKIRQSLGLQKVHILHAEDILRFSLLFWKFQKIIFQSSFRGLIRCNIEPLGSDS